MKKLTTPSGQQFFVHSQNKGPLVVYMSGLNEKAETGIFAQDFCRNDNLERFTIVTVSNPTGIGWESPRANKTKYLGQLVVEEICEQLGYEKTNYVGHSLGGDLDVVARLADKLSSVCICAGSANNPWAESIIEFAKKKIPMRFYHGDKDGATPNHYAAGKAVYEKIVSNGGDATFKTIVGGDHASSIRTACSSAEKLGEWFLSKSSPIIKDPEPEISGINIPLKSIYLRGADKKVVFEFEDGTIKEWPE